MLKIARLLVVPVLTGLAVMAPAAITPKEVPAAMAAEFDQKFPTADQANAFLRTLEMAGYNSKPGYIAYAYAAGNGWYAVHWITP
jgi:hypothetical protein